MGNVKIINDDIVAKLPDGSIILGSAEYGGIIYYVLQVPKKDKNNQPI